MGGEAEGVCGKREYDMNFLELVKQNLKLIGPNDRLM